MKERPTAVDWVAKADELSDRLEGLDGRQRAGAEKLWPACLAYLKNAGVDPGSSVSQKERASLGQSATRLRTRGSYRIARSG